MTDNRRKRAANTDAKVQCFVCGTLEPLLTAQDHHRKPRAFGGTDEGENRVWLCASCHARLHRVQEFLVQGQPAAAFDLCASIFPTNAKARANLWTLANEAAAAEREVKDVFDMHRSEVAVKLSVNTEIWNLLKACAKDRGMPVSALAVAILTDAARKL